jgi:lysophospholipase L1-like esterase
MPLGDSITSGDNVYGTYRSWLWNDLFEARYNVDFVGSQVGVYGGPPVPSNFDLDHEGHHGWTANQMVPFVAGWATSAVPDVVLMHLGTNDLLTGLPVFTIISDLQQIITDLRQGNPNVTVLLAQIIPSTAPNLLGTIPLLNMQIPGLAAAMTTPTSTVVPVDQWSGFNPVLETYDGLHPHALGNRKIASRWLTALGPHLGGLHLSISQNLGAGSAVIRNLGGVPFHEYLTVFTFNGANAGAGFGTGWFGGLHIDFNEVVTQFLFGVPPFYGFLDDRGGSEVVFPVGTFSALSGLTLYATSHVIVTSTATFVENSPPVSLLFL